MRRFICLFLYYGFAQYLPASTTGIELGKTIRYFLVKRIFKKCGCNVNVEKGAQFGSGKNIEIGDNSGIGINCHCPSNIIIGNDVMMGPNVQFFSNNHKYSRTDIPMNKQGETSHLVTVVEDDVWIGASVIITPGRRISQGSIVAAGCVLTKDYPAYSIIGGNPSMFIKSRLSLNNN